MEISVEDGHPVVEIALGADTAFDSANKDEQKPAEGNAPVHVSQPPVLFGNAQVQQAFAEHFPDGGQELDGDDILEQGLLLQTVKLPYPANVFVQADNQERDGSQYKWQYERTEVFHYPMISLVLVSI